MEDDGARKELLRLFEAWGPTDPASIAGRKSFPGSCSRKKRGQPRHNRP
jgi:hypothetical protein